MIKNCVLIFAIIIIFIAVYYPSRHARRYDYIVLENILDQLDLRKPKNFDFNLKNCSYEDLIINNQDVHAISEKTTFQKTLPGGEYKPESCVPLIKTALIVPYRNRQQHLSVFLKYMHSFLQAQNIHYRIFIVDQNDTLPFNRAKMINYGARLAMKIKYHCLILHDVDLLPMNTGNLYGCTKLPRHMSSSLDTFRYNLPYLTLFGGAVAISSEQFQKVNGMSNTFYGWGGEDDDLYRFVDFHTKFSNLYYTGCGRDFVRVEVKPKRPPAFLQLDLHRRLVNNNLDPCRFAPQVSRYIMLPHKKEKASKDRFRLLQEAEDNQMDDGLNLLPNRYLVKTEDLYTHIITS